MADPIFSISLSCFLIFCHVLLALTLPSASAINGRFELIHRDYSPKSPFYNPNATHFHRTLSAVQRSLLRAKHIGRALSSTRSPSNASSSIRSKLRPNSDDNSYLMAFQIGTPALDVVAVADTGSDLIWFNCKPCTSCYAQSAPMYDPTKSSTYGEVSCRSEPCKHVPSNSCGGRNDSRCRYHYKYGGQQHVEGVLSRETFNFATAAGAGSVKLPKMIFGCSHQSHGLFAKISAGLVGLGGGRLSLISQLGAAIHRKISYCLVPFADVRGNNWLSLGNSGVHIPPAVKVHRTPLILTPHGDSYYFLSLKEIDVAGRKIPVPQFTSDPVNNHPGKNNIIIDSGTTETFLYPEVIRGVVDALSAVIELERVTDPDYRYWGVCYETDKGISGEDFPEMTFRFDGAAVELGAENTFMEVGVPGVVCLAMVSTGYIKAPTPMIYILL